MTRSRFFNFFPRLAIAFCVGGFFLTIGGFLLSSPSFAVDNILLQKQAAIKSGSGLESWSNEAMTSNVVILFNGMAGDIPEGVFETGSSKEKDSVINTFRPGGAFGTMTTMIAALNTPPASGIDYIAQVKDNFLGKPAYAQGVGFNGLQFLLPLWRGFRNAVYVLASIIFVVIGLMIMLRVKISPQAVVTVQSAIPQLITTLILVTFSYAIAGLVIDISNFIQALVVALLFSVKGVPISGNLFPGWWGGNGIPILSDVINGITAFFVDKTGTFSFAHLSNPDLRDMQMLTYRAVPGWLSMVMLGGLLGSIVLGFLLGGVGAVFGSGTNAVFDGIGRVVGGGVGGVVGLFIPLIMCIIVAIWLIKLYFGLLKCYVTLIFKIVLAPLEIGMGAFPNAKMGFSSWILDVASNMAVFPVVGIFLVLLNMIIDAVAGTNVGTSSLNSAVWAPSLISSGGISPTIISASIGLAGLALVSKLPEMVPQYIFMIKPSPWGQAIGEGLSKNAATGLAGKLAGGVEKQVTEDFGRDVTTGFNESRAGEAIVEGKRRFRSWQGNNRLKRYNRKHGLDANAPVGTSMPGSTSTNDKSGGNSPDEISE